MFIRKLILLFENYFNQIAGMRAGYILITLVTTALSLAIAFYCGWRIALIVLCFVPFIFFGNWIQMRMKFQSYVQECETTERVAKVLFKLHF